MQIHQDSPEAVHIAPQINTTRNIEAASGLRCTEQLIDLAREPGTLKKRLDDAVLEWRYGLENHKSKMGYGKFLRRHVFVEEVLWAHDIRVPTGVGDKRKVLVVLIQELRTFHARYST